ncbi:alpha-2-macroglobulin-like [Oryctolagus cuniculus]|uniref:alpha-2-macroglobulin-like n=1 Tax=Oryctolagus cuniculus TaxID=9986 RepID=UPI00387A3046
MDSHRSPTVTVSDALTVLGCRESFLGPTILPVPGGNTAIPRICYQQVPCLVNPRVCDRNPRSLLTKTGPQILQCVGGVCVRQLERSDHVNQTEVSTNHVLIYLDKVSNQTLSLSFTVVQEIPVIDLKPAIVKVYDYQETDKFAIAEYNAPCSKDGENA